MRGGTGVQEGGSVRWAGCLGAWWQVRRTGRRLKEVGRQIGRGAGASRGLRQMGGVGRGGPACRSGWSLGNIAVVA